MSQLKVGINGFGRIGSMLFRAGLEKVSVVGINDLSDSKQLAHLLKYDSIHGQFFGEVSAKENSLTVNGKDIPIAAERDPAQIPWKEWGADIVFECTGVFKNKPDIQKHISGGAKKVIVSAPISDADLTVVYGINQNIYNPSEHQILSNASCTTNCLAPVTQVIHKCFGIKKGLVTTIHSYTNDQNVLDSGHKDLRRARAAALSMIPTTTGAAVAVGKVLPELNGKLNGLAVRVPTPNVSLVDLVFESEKTLSAEAINKAFQEASETYLQGILGCELKPLVSSDFMGDSRSSVVDMLSTMVVGGNMGKVLSWYDNEVGFSHRMIDLALYMQKQGL